MEAPKPTREDNLINIEKEIKSQQGNNYILKIYYNDNNFCIQVEKKGKIFDSIFVQKLSITQIQENQYFKLFSSPKEILEELKERIELKNPILNECQNNIIALIIFLPISKFKQIEFTLLKHNNKLKENREYLESIIEKFCEEIESLKKENIQLKEENKQIKLRLENIEKKIDKEIILKKYNNFRWINKEVIIVKNSEFLPDFTPDIILGKSIQNSYALSSGNRNHFIEFAFIKTYFLKSIRISVANYECSLKTFMIETKEQNGTFNNIGTFIRSQYKDNSSFQEFEIIKECNGIKLILIDNWGSVGGNYILISKLDFLVSD